MTQLLSDLRAVRELLSKPERWTQRAFARDAEGLAVMRSGAFLEKGKSCCFCLDGAICMVTQCDPTRRNACQAAILSQTPAANQSAVKSSTWKFNDTHTHAEVLTLLDRTIKQAEGGRRG